MGIHRPSPSGTRKRWPHAYLTPAVTTESVTRALSTQHSPPALWAPVRLPLPVFVVDDNRREICATGLLFVGLPACAPHTASAQFAHLAAAVATVGLEGLRLFLA